MDSQKLGRNIRKARESAGMTQAELARTVGISENYMHFIEVGRKEPSLRTAVIIATELNTTVDKLVMN